MRYKDQDHFEEQPCFRSDEQAARKGFPSETHVRRGKRIVHGTKELEEKHGRNDLCPLRLWSNLQEMLSKQSCF